MRLLILGVLLVGCSRTVSWQEVQAVPPPKPMAEKTPAEQAADLAARRRASAQQQAHYRAVAESLDEGERPKKVELQCRPDAIRPGQLICAER